MTDPLGTRRATPTTPAAIRSRSPTPAATYTTAYDALDRATTITDADGDVTTIAYDAGGREVGLTDPDGNRTTWAYDARRPHDRPRPTRMGTVATYAYDADGETDR